jgi:dipeptidyl aminopeptidase/acylaminoacyl peptidase
MVRVRVVSLPAPLHASSRRLTLVAGVAALLACSPAHAACQEVLPADSDQAGTKRPVTAEDIVLLRDIGSPDAATPDVPSPLSVSPDGSRIAFVISRANPASNRYCRALVVQSLAAGTSPVIVDRGGDYIGVRVVVRGLFVEVGTPKTVTPAWSPDGRWIVYVKREHGTTQLWRARSDGSAANQVSHADFDIEGVVWPADSEVPLIAGRPGMPAASVAIEREGLSGWLYDDRVATNSGPRPQVRATQAPIEIFAIDPETGRMTVADEHRKQDFARLSGQTGGPEAIAENGRRAWTEGKTRSIISPRQLWATDPHGRSIRCDVPACVGKTTGLWWDRSGTVLTVLRHEGWDNENTALYQWNPGVSRMHRILTTLDALQGCVPAGDNLVCTRENAITPRQVVLLNPVTGGSQTIFDPNPEFRNIALGTVRRPWWRNKHDFEAWGDLVLPPHYRPGTKLPMIVVQYHSRGFLRGGTNNDYPIYLFAAHGFAVLSLERPTVVASLYPKLISLEALNRANYEGWAEHASLLSSLVAGVKAAVATGAIDSSRIGLTGLSDGATLARYALINTHLFRAAAISTCCLEPKTVMTYGGIAWAKFNRKMGFPLATRDDPGFWAPMSIAQNAATMNTPLLMQLADDEYILALEAFEALREHGKPVDLYVFPGEHHGKWQPAHRLAIYQRDLDWFAFWLQGREDPALAKRTQYRRWEAMRAKRARSATTSVPKLRHRPGA